MKHTDPHISPNSQNNSAPGFVDHPEHKITIQSSPNKTIVSFLNIELANSCNSLQLCENNYPPVFYLPRSDVLFNFLVVSKHKTYCPFKGEASYWSINLPELNSGKILENVAWSYETPFNEMLSIKDCVAFDTNKINVREMD